MLFLGKMRNREREGGWEDLERPDGRGVVAGRLDGRGLTKSGLSAKTRSRDKRVTSDDVIQF